MQTIKWIKQCGTSFVTVRSTNEEKPDVWFMYFYFNWTFARNVAHLLAVASLPCLCQCDVKIALRQIPVKKNSEDFREMDK